MGDVLEAIDVATNEPLALKILKRELAQDPVQVERFLREARALARLEHPAIVRVGSCGPTPEGGIYLTMELVQGETLTRLLRRRGTLSVDAITPILRDLALGLHWAHERGIVHRDLKPSNVIVMAPHDPDRPVGAKLIDFGVAMLAGAARVTSTGEYVGTPRYMAPEQLASASSAEPRSDVYALGVLVYEMLAGTSPFPAEHGPAALISAVLRGEAVPLRARRPDLPGELEVLVSRAIAVRPEHRHPSTMALFEEWDRVTRPVATGVGTIAMEAISSSDLLGATGPSQTKQFPSPAPAASPQPAYPATYDSAAAHGHAPPAAHEAQPAARLAATTAMPAYPDAAAAAAAPRPIAGPGASVRPPPMQPSAPAAPHRANPPGPGPAVPSHPSAGAPTFAPAPPQPAGRGGGTWLRIAIAAVLAIGALFAVTAIGVVAWALLR
jgi:serine/threonine-protein kinase